MDAVEIPGQDSMRWQYFGRLIENESRGMTEGGWWLIVEVAIKQLEVAKLTASRADFTS